VLVRALREFAQCTAIAGLVLPSGNARARALTNAQNSGPLEGNITQCNLLPPMRDTLGETGRRVAVVHCRKAEYPLIPG
jgi:hypothetical protein